MVLENREKKSGMENSGMEMDTAQLKIKENY